MIGGRYARMHNSINHMERNIKYLQYILPLKKAMFWMGIWLIFYLKFTDYGGIGLLEASMFFFGIALEIPTGALADLIGKKYSLIIAFFFQAVGHIYMGFAGSLTDLYIALAFLMFGSAFYSGTAEAILFDSMKTINKEDGFQKVMANISRNTLILIGVSSFVGGFMYQVNEGLPYFANGFVQLIGLVLIILLITEPPIDTEKFSIRNYFKQTFSGSVHLFNNKISNLVLVLLFITSGTYYIFDSLVDSVIPLELGLTEIQLGILFAIIPFIAAVASLYYQYIKIKTTHLVWILPLVFLITIFAGVVFQDFVIVGLIIILMRVVFGEIFNIVESDYLNKRIESKWRATTLSSYSMLR